MKISIIGGGNLGHTCLSLFSKNKLNVTLITRNPQMFSKYQLLKTYDNTETVDISKATITSNFSAIYGSDIILCTTPTNTYEQIFKNIKPYASSSKIGCIYQSPFIDYTFNRILPNNKLFCFQYVPFQAKVIEYGKSSHIVGIKKNINVAGDLSNIEQLFGIPMNKCSFLSFILTSSNPILHMPRYYDMYKNLRNLPSGPYEQIKFEGSLYRDMNLSSSVIINDIMLEILNIKKKLLEIKPINLDNVVHIIQRVEEQYGNQVEDYSNIKTMFNTSSMYRKSSIMFRKYPNDPMLYPDISHRHFTDDLLHGLCPIQSLARHLKVDTPTINICVEWGLNISKLKYKVPVNIYNYINER
jgi:ketopantoate reductase